MAEDYGAFSTIHEMNFPTEDSPIFLSTFYLKQKLNMNHLNLQKPLGRYWLLEIAAITTATSI